jgi:hypothetical protein
MLKGINVMPKEPEFTKLEDLKSTILSAERKSIMFAIPIGLASGLIAYFAAPVFPLACSLLVGVGSIVIVSVLLFQFRFGKDLPKRTISPDEYGSPLSFDEPSSENSGIQALNRSNGNPSADFIMPPNN